MSRRAQDTFFPTVGALALTALLFFVSYELVTRFQRAADSKPVRPNVVVVPEGELPLVATGTPHAPPAESLAMEVKPTEGQYLVVTDSCGPFFAGECVRVRSGPGTEHSVVGTLRNGMVLKVGETVSKNGMTWHEVIFDEWLRYPERLGGKWYVADAFVTLVEAAEPQTLGSTTAASTTKRIVVDRSEQTLSAYDGDMLIKTYTISTGLELTPTPRGTFSVYYKTPTRYMQGPLPWLVDQQYYDLPGVPWNLYFTEQGAVIHGAYWHDSFGKPYSHGCVNVDPNEARELYEWAPLGTPVIVQD
jgi:lipoprotein-anchoring transpeptidase ErfK/SrfK